MKKKLIALLCIVSLCVTNVMPAFATESTSNVDGVKKEMESISMEKVNPLYADVISEEDLNDVPEDVPSLYTREIEYEDDLKVIGATIREAMAGRMETVSVNVQTGENVGDKTGLGLYMDSLLEEAFAEEDAKPNEGDYLRWQYAGYKVGLSGYMESGVYYVTITIQFTYYTTDEQEASVDAKIDEVLNEQLNLDELNLSDYEKTQAIYDYICENVVYDYDNLTNDEYKLKYSAYAALMNGTSVCQGYAVLFYRMLEEVGIDARVVDGIGNGGPHGWNISKLGGKYYYSDATWDAGNDQYQYFLKGKQQFEQKHVPNLSSAVYEEKYANALSETNFIVAKGSCGKNSTWILDEEGTLTISGVGAISDNSGYGKHKATIKKLVIEEGITRIEAGVFASFYNLSGQVVLPESIEYIGENAFYNCMMIPKYIILNKNCEIYDSKDVFYSQLPLAGHYGSTAQAYAEKYSRRFSHATNVWESEYSVEVEPTCTEQGIQGIKCANCNFWKEQMYISCKGHTEEIIPAVEPTCEDTGITVGVKCSTCGEVFQEQETVDALGHTEETTPAVEPTCKETGLTEGKKCSVCNETLEEQEVIPVLAHTEETVPGKVPTCKETGLTEGKKCSVCNETLVEQKVIPVAHSWNKNYTVDKAATCETAGSKSIHCAKCSATKNVTAIAKVAHKWNKGVIKPAPTCTKTGTKTYTCSSCGGPKTETIKATGHNYKIIKTTKATTKKNGKLAKQCKVCKYKTTTTLYYAKSVSLSKTKFTYNGKTQKPKVVVKDSKGKVISSSNYKVSYSKGCKNAGTYKVTVTFKGQYSGKLTKTFKITKAKQVITAKNFTKKKGDKAFSINAKRSSGGGKLTYKTSNKKIATVSSKGKVTIKKAGKVTITITAASNKNYNKATKKITVTIK